MTRLRFDQLLNLYRHVAFDPQGDEGELSLVDQSVLDDLRFVHRDPRAADDADLVVLSDELESLAVGQKVRIRAGAPRLALGQLVRSLDNLLVSSEARLREPAAYFIIDGAIEKTAEPPPDDVVRYRKALEIANLFGKAASYLDKNRQELVFIRDRKITIPISYDVAALRRMSVEAADSVLKDLAADVHQDQKLSILAEAILHVAQPQPAVSAFAHLLANLDAVGEEVRNGYKLFASSFSYSKIRNEVEAARLDYIGKIHKTIVDIQGQLLGIPVATIIVGSQLKPTQGCGVDFWANVTVVAGSWIFLLLLMIAIGNQWATLAAIRADVNRQRLKLQGDYAAISDQFAGVYEGLESRVFRHRIWLGVIALIGLAGVAFATFLFFHLTAIDARVCMGFNSSSHVQSPPQPTTIPAAAPP